jgi:putative transcriptional regulator
MRDDHAVSDARLRGRLLVAAPPLVDPNFDRTVVLMLEHGDDGALGLVLNRPGTTDLVEAVPDWSGLASEPAVVFAGGPVQTDAVIALARSDVDEERDGWVPVGQGLGTVDLARPPIDVPVRIDAVRVFVGYAGWAPGQLEGELEAGAWFVVDVLPDDVFGVEPRSLWQRVLRRQPGRLAMFANSPADPSTN